jgi:hypothetical protein
MPDTLRPNRDTDSSATSTTTSPSRGAKPICVRRPRRRAAARGDKPTGGHREAREPQPLPYGNSHLFNTHRYQLPLRVTMWHEVFRHELRVYDGN